MCTLDNSADALKAPDISRRFFAATALAGAAALSLTPLRAAGILSEALCVMCIDPRLVDRGVKFFDEKVPPISPPQGRLPYDIVALAGASLAAVGPAFPDSSAAFWSHVDIAKGLHHIKKILVLDHRQCGAYEVQFGRQYAVGDPGELKQHTEIMKLVRAEAERRKVGLPIEFYLMPIDPNERTIKVEV
jgi:hypothetical protein